MKTSSVSVITFVYADERNGRIGLLRECLESVKAQKFPNYEHIIVDDGSAIDLAPMLGEYPNTVLIRKQCTGILSSTTTFNLGQCHAKGDYCIYLASDDVHCKDALATLAKTLDENPNSVWAIGKAIYEKGDAVSSVWTPNFENIINKMNVGNYVNGCAVMWRNSAEFKSFLPPHYTGFCSDYDFWCTLVKLSAPTLVNHHIVKYRLAADSTRNKTRSRLITSARAADRMRFQYSKKARIKFVQDRLNLKNLSEYSVTLRASFDEKFKAISNTTLEIVKNHDWHLLDPSLFSDDGSYSALKKQIISKDAHQRFLVVIPFENVRDIIFAQTVKDHCEFIVETNASNDAWLFEFLPISRVKQIRNMQGKPRKDLMDFLGIGNK